MPTGTASSKKPKTNSKSAGTKSTTKISKKDEEIVKKRLKKLLESEKATKSVRTGSSKSAAGCSNGSCSLDAKPTKKISSRSSKSPSCSTGACYFKKKDDNVSKNKTTTTRSKPKTTTTKAKTTNATTTKKTKSTTAKKVTSNSKKISCSNGQCDLKAKPKPKPKTKPKPKSSTTSTKSKSTSMQCSSGECFFLKDSSKMAKKTNSTKSTLKRKSEEVKAKQLPAKKPKSVAVKKKPPTKVKTSTTKRKTPPKKVTPIQKSGKKGCSVPSRNALVKKANSKQICAPCAPSSDSEDSDDDYSDEDDYSDDFTDEETDFEDTDDDSEDGSYGCYGPTNRKAPKKRNNSCGQDSWETESEDESFSCNTGPCFFNRKGNTSPVEDNSRLALLPSNHKFDDESQSYSDDESYSYSDDESYSYSDDETFDPYDFKGDYDESDDSYSEEEEESWEDGGSVDEDYQLPDDEEEDLYIPKGEAFIYPCEDDEGIDFDSDGSSLQLFELPSRPPSKPNTSIEKENLDDAESVDSCPQLIPIQDNALNDGQGDSISIDDSESTDSENELCKMSPHIFVVSNEVNKKEKTENNAIPCIFDISLSSNENNETNNKDTERHLIEDLTPLQRSCGIHASLCSDVSKFKVSTAKFNPALFESEFSLHVADDEEDLEETIKTKKSVERSVSPFEMNLDSQNKVDVDENAEDDRFEEDEEVVDEMDVDENLEDDNFEEDEQIGEEDVDENEVDDNFVENEKTDEEDVDENVEEDSYEEDEKAEEVDEDENEEDDNSEKSVEVDEDENVEDDNSEEDERTVEKFYNKMDVDEKKEYKSSRSQKMTPNRSRRYSKLELQSKFYNAINSRHVLLLIRNPFYIYGTLKVKLLAGKIEIFGYEPKINEIHEIYSPRGYSRLYMKPISRKNSNFNREQLRKELNNFDKDFHRTELDEITEEFNEHEDAIVLLEANDQNGVAKMIKKYIKQNLFPNMNTISHERPYCASEFILRCILYTNSMNSIKINYNWDSIHIKEQSKILIIGGKSVGKSTLIRYLINRNLNCFKKFLLIDLDIGQTEVFVPQTISATLIEKPLLGPGYFYCFDPEKSYVYGDINVVLSPMRYLKIVKKLIEWCENNEKFQNIPWIVNTMGYNKGFGSELISIIAQILNPTEILQIQSTKEINNFDFPMCPDVIKSIPRVVCTDELDLKEYVPRHKLLLFQSMEKKGSFEWDMTPKDVRFTIFICRLGAILGEKHEWITDVKPICAPLDELNIIYFGEDNLDKDALCNIVNANLVYLCRNDDRNNTECFGIGIVRGVDRSQKTVYLLPAMKLSQLVNVNTLAICNIPLPTAILLKQGPKIKGAVPYTYSTCKEQITSMHVNQIYYRPQKFLHGAAPRRNILQF